MKPDRYADPKGKGWSTPGWIFLHSLANGFPENPTELDKKYMLDIFQGLSFSMECEDCNAHLREDLKAFPPNVESKLAFQQYLNDLHNRVNVRNGKRAFTLTESQEIQQRLRHINWQQVFEDCHLLDDILQKHSIVSPKSFPANDNQRNTIQEQKQHLSEPQKLPRQDNPLLQKQNSLFHQTLNVTKEGDLLMFGFAAIIAGGCLYLAMSK